MSETTKAAPSTTIDTVNNKPCGECVKTNSQQKVTIKGKYTDVSQVKVLIAKTKQELDSCLMMPTGPLCPAAKEATLNPSSGTWTIDLNAVRFNSDSNCQPTDATVNYVRAWGKHATGYATDNCTFYAWTEQTTPPNPDNPTTQQEGG